MTQQIIDLIEETQTDIADLGTAMMTGLTGLDTKMEAIKTLVEALDPEEPPEPTIGFFREYGATMSNGASGKIIDISTYGVLSDDNPPYFIEGEATSVDLTTTGLGGLDAGSPAANTTYHIFLIHNPTTEVSGAIASTSPTSPTMPEGFTKKTCIGSPPPTDTGADFPYFSQREKEFLLGTPKGYPSISNPGTSEALRTLHVPTGVQVNALAMFAIYSADASPKSLLVTSPDQNNTVPDGTNYSLRTADAGPDRQSGAFSVRTDTMGRVRTRFSASNAGTALFYSLQGWIDSRARGL